MQTLLRRLKGAAFNALFWGVAWFGIGFVFDAALRLASGGLVYASSLYLLPPFIAGIGTGLIGMAVGGIFSLFVAANFRHRDVDELSAWRFAGGGALVTMAVALGLFYLTGGEGMVDAVIVDPAGLYRSLLTSGLIVGGIGGSTAFATIKLAQRAPEDRLQRAPTDLLSR